MFSSEKKEKRKSFEVLKNKTGPSQKTALLDTTRKKGSFLRKRFVDPNSPS